MADKTDVQRLVTQLMAGATPEEGKALLDALMTGQVTSIFEKLKRDERPELLPVPERPRGFRVRLDLHGAKPPVWRRLELPGDLTLPRVHVAIQAAMGWYDSHLHRFRIANDHRSAYFATEFDLDEGDDGMPESDVRLDQILAERGDELWYEYDFGDGWDHKLLVEAVLDDPPRPCGAPPGGWPVHRRTAEESGATTRSPPGCAVGTTTPCSRSRSRTPNMGGSGCQSTGIPTTSISTRPTRRWRSRAPSPSRSPGNWPSWPTSWNGAESRR